MQKPVFGIVLMLAMLVSTPIFSQKKEIKAKFGKISDEEISMKNYAPDPNAAAVILFDKADVTHPFTQENGFSQSYERHIRVKIFKKEALDLANWTLEFYGGQKFSDFKASSYNLENGKIVETELDKAQVFDEKLTKTFSIRKFALPAIREGSIFEIKFILRNEDAIGVPNWTFQHPDVPTIWSEFKAEIPTIIEFDKVATGWEPFSIAKESEDVKNLSLRFTNRGDRTVTINATETVKCDYNTKKMHFVVENAPALKIENHVASLRDHLTQIKFKIAAVYAIEFVPIMGKDYKIVNGVAKVRNETWPRLGHDLLEEWLDGHLDSDKFTSAEAEKAVSGKTTTSEKVAAIYSHIGKNYQAQNFDFIAKTQPLKSLTEGHKGTPTDLNLLCINMLRRAKVKAWPVLISTRKHGQVLDWNVSLFAFDRILTAFETDEKQLVLLDVSAWPNPIGLMPIEDLNGDGLLITGKESVEWVPLANKIPNREAIVSDLNLTADGHLKGNLTFSESGYQATDFREKLAASNEKTVVSEKFKDLIGDGKLTENKLENAENPLETSLKGSFLLETKSFVTSSGGKIYLQPALGLGDREQPFKAAERKFNIDLGTPSDLNLNFTYSIPAGYKVEEMPKSAKIVFGENAMTFEYLTEIKDDKMKLSVRKKVKKTYFEAAEYADMKQFYSAILAKMGEQVVLTKI